MDRFLASYPGFNVLRVWDYVTWPGTGWESIPADVWVTFLSYVGLRGWWVELTLLTDDDPARIEPARALVQGLQGFGVQNLLLEAGNEPTTHKSIDTAALRGVLEASGFPYTSGDYEDSDRWFGTYYVCHTGRTRDWTRRAHDLFDFFTGAGPDKPTHVHHVPCLGDEPGKLQDVGGTPSEWRAYFGACSIMGGGATVHLETGKFAQPPTDAERPCIVAALEGLEAFPADATRAIASYRRIDETDQPPDSRTYVIGRYAVRCQRTGTTFPEPGWSPLDPDGVLWTKP